MKIKNPRDVSQRTRIRLFSSLQRGIILSKTENPRLLMRIRRRRGYMSRLMLWKNKVSPDVDICQKIGKPLALSPAVYTRQSMKN